ncbi:MAG: DUF4126 family protein [Armatimonadota bacterium]
MTYWKSLGIGAIAGMRSMTAPALVSDSLSRGETPSNGTLAARLLESPEAASALKVLAAGEMAADKTPWIPDRVAPLGLLGRAATGAAAGAAVCDDEHCRPEIAAMMGAAAAVVSACGMYGLRRALGRSLPVPDAVLGAAEDALALGGGRMLLRASETGTVPVGRVPFPEFDYTEFSRLKIEPAG